jgi:uncharacterized protein Yka (UPF0111/DUF47 family)
MARSFDILDNRMDCLERELLRLAARIEKLEEPQKYAGATAALKAADEIISVAKRFRKVEDRTDELERNLAKRVFRLENALFKAGLLNEGLIKPTRCPTCHQAVGDD